MPEAWIQLECPECGHDWEREPTDLPNTDAEFECPDCGAQRLMAEFAKTQRDLELREQFES